MGTTDHGWDRSWVGPIVGATAYFCAEDRAMAPQLAEPCEANKVHDASTALEGADDGSREGAATAAR
jgi:hypothetical protein